MINTNAEIRLKPSRSWGDQSQPMMHKYGYKYWYYTGTGKDTGIQNFFKNLGYDT